MNLSEIIKKHPYHLIPDKSVCTYHINLQRTYIVYPHNIRLGQDDNYYVFLTEYNKWFDYKFFLKTPFSIN